MSADDVARRAGVGRADTPEGQVRRRLREALLSPGTYAVSDRTMATRLDALLPVVERVARQRAADELERVLSLNLPPTVAILVQARVSVLRTESPTGQGGSR